MLDKTGLTGKYDFSLEYTATRSALPQPVEGPVDSGPDFATALEQQLGLKLLPSRASLDVVVIDTIERTPTEN